MDHKVNVREQSVGGEAVILELIREKSELFKDTFVEAGSFTVSAL